MKVNNLKFSIQDDDCNWQEIKGFKEINPPSNKHYTLISTIYVLDDEKFAELNKPLYEDLWLGKPFVGVFFSRTEWNNQGGE